MTRLARLPIRIRVTLAFAGVMAVVLAATGVFLLVRMGAALDESIEEGLRARAGDAVALVRQAGANVGSRRGLDEDGENAVQVLDTSGAVVDATPRARGAPLLDAAELRRARRDTVMFDKEDILDVDVARVLATPVHARGRSLVVVVTADLEDRRDALSSLGKLLLIGGPIALLLASLAGYGAAAAALRPVERMRRRAAAIRTASSERLPVPPARDEIGRLGATLNEMLARLEAAFARERRFVADASHELRTPLAILKAELELAQRRGRSVEALQAALASAAEETDRLVQLAEDLLIIARSDRAQLPIRAETLAAGEVLGAARARFAGRAADAGSTLTVEAPEGLEVSADPLRLDQAIGNLVDNALRHGGGDIRLGATPHGDAVRLWVRDDGPGFPHAFIDSAFERFTRADSARSRGGAGLGLAIVQAIARAHGGGVGAMNLPEGGAEVWFEVPRVAADAELRATTLGSAARSSNS